MARIVVITHPDDPWGRRDYMLASIAGFWQEAGHEVVRHADLDTLPDGDLGVLHVDLSVVPELFHAVWRRYPHVVNGRVFDIRKTAVSEAVLSEDDPWEGPVVVKTNLNCFGLPEVAMAQKWRTEGRDLSAFKGLIGSRKPYPIYRTRAEVPAEAWTNPGLVVEKFLPERDDEGWWIRSWVFLGDRERCRRLRGTHPIVKSDNIVERQDVPVPERLREVRARLGFDYGKFDFVVRDGEVTLFDANKTPSASPARVQTGGPPPNRLLAEGVSVWLKGAR